MSSAILDSGYHADPESGYFLSDKHQRIAEIVHDYNPELALVWVPAPQRTRDDVGKEFAIVHTQQNGSQYVVFYIAEQDLDHRVLARLWAHDMRRTDVLTQLELEEMALQMTQAKREEDEAAERRDFMLSVLKSPKHTYTLPSGRKLNK